MSTENFSVYLQGARFDNNDFDAIKLMLFYLSKKNISLSARSFQKLQERQFDIKTAKELCCVFGTTMSEGDMTEDYNFIMAELLDDVTSLFYVNEGEVSPFNTENAYGFMFPELEGEFLFDSEKEAEELDGCLMMLCFSVPYVWSQDNKGPKTRQQAVEMLHEAAKPLLRSDIDWDERLGKAIAFGYC